MCIRSPRRHAALLTSLLLLLSVVAGCSRSASEENPRELLAEAKRKLDRASSARFVLTTAGVPEDTASLVGGKGVLARPGRFQGDLEVRMGGGTARVSIISVDGDVFAKLPFANAYAKTDPAQFGLSDPADLMDPDKGLSTLLVKATDVKLVGERRIGTEVVHEVVGKVPGRLVDDLLVSADPAKPVNAKFALTKETGEVRRVSLTGPFFKAGVNSTLTMTLDRFGDKVTITRPDVASP